MSFTNLAAELQIDIFSYLSNTDLKNVRAVSTCCRDNASVWLFHTVIACARYTAMGAFQNISLHPVYQKYVKEIVFDATQYDRTLASDERLYTQRASQFEELTNAVSWHRHTRFKKYQARYEEQETIKRDGVLLQTIAKALEWMPNVHSVVFTSVPRTLPVERKDVRDIVPREFESQNWSSSRETPFPPPRVNLQTGFHHLIGAVALAGYAGVREFRVEPRLEHDGRFHLADRTVDKPGPFAFGVKDFHFPEQSHFAAGKHFFEHLTSVDVTFGAFHRDTSAECFVNMRALLAEAKGLQRLRVSADHRLMGFTRVPAAHSEHSASTFGLLGLDASWPSLTHVTLQGILATEKELRDMLARGHGVLESLRFLRCILRKGGRWSNLVEEIVDGTQIREFVLDGVCEADLGIGLFSRIDMSQYEGYLRTDENGERHFEEPADKSIYAWQKFVRSESE